MSVCGVCVESASGCGLVGTSAWLGGLGTPPD